jgi:hypothetical protein
MVYLGKIIFLYDGNNAGDLLKIQAPNILIPCWQKNEKKDEKQEKEYSSFHGD